MAAKDYDHLFKLLIIGELEMPLLLQLLFFLHLFVAQETREWGKVRCLFDLQIIISAGTTSPLLV